ncbi:MULTISPECIES: helix-turn-helix transcriptional regulator [unclassified Novosphingobium]|uniref:helix-turn-helix domain-containing protein n=1 Tax=unclassified Novosphingobium TaxID=2644732 RepID=UPI00135BC340|nr:MULTISPECIES: helix-turn-helix transcriptional regulator [unclassified Novosphingobium]
MTLRDYLAEAQLSYGAFAKKIGVKNGRTVHRYVEGQRYPRPNLLVAIARETDGKVQPNDFLASHGG